MKDFDSALFDVLKVQPEEYAVSGTFNVLTAFSYEFFFITCGAYSI